MNALFIILGMLFAALVFGVLRLFMAVHDYHNSTLQDFRERVELEKKFLDEQKIRMN